MSQSPDADAAPTPTTPTPPGGPVVSEERMHPLTPIVRLWIGVVAFGWYVVTSLLEGQDPFWDADALALNTPWWVPLVGAGLVIGLGAGYWSWWTTRFVIDAHEVRVENRGAFQESKRIAFSRIQSVDVAQPFAARLLGLAELRIDAGADAGTRLAFLTRARATELRDYLMVRAHGRDAEPSVAAAPASARDDLGAADLVLIRLTPADIVLGALLSLELVALVAAFAVPLAIAAWFDVPMLAIGGGLVPLALALVGYLSRRLFQQYNYTLAVTPAGLRISRGLTTLRSQTIPAHRVQSLRITQPLPWRLVNRARLDVTVLGVGDVDDGGELSTATIFLPIGTPQQVQVALSALWPGLRLDALTFRPAPRRARWLDPLGWRWTAHAHDAQVVVGRRGALTRSQIVVPHARLQSVRLHQGPWERRLGLADVALHTTNTLGVDRVVHLDAAEARGLLLAELGRARAARIDELLSPPGLRAAPPWQPTPPPGLPAAPPGPWRGGAPASGTPDLWAPPSLPAWRAGAAPPQGPAAE